MRMIISLSARKNHTSRADSVIIAHWAYNAIIALYLRKYSILWLTQNGNNLLAERPDAKFGLIFGV